MPTPTQAPEALGIITPKPLVRAVSSSKEALSPPDKVASSKVRVEALGTITLKALASRAASSKDTPRALANVVSRSKAAKVARACPEAVPQAVPQVCRHSCKVFPVAANRAANQAGAYREVGKGKEAR